MSDVAPPSPPFPQDPEAEHAMIEAPESAHHAQHHSSGNPWLDRVLGIAVLLVSAGSLYVALHTGHVMEELVHQNERLVRAQSTPILQYDHGNISDSGMPQLDFTVRNVGTGPARVMWTEISYGGKYYRRWDDFVRSQGKGMATFTTAPINGSVLSVGEERHLLTWKKPGNGDGLSRWALVDRLRFEAKTRACYCSVFDQCWISNMQADLPQEVGRCDAPQAAGQSAH